MRLVQRTLTLFCLTALALDLSGCSMLTKNGRSQAAYNRYLKRAGVARERNKIKYGKPKKVEAPVTSDESAPIQQSGPEAATSGNR